MRVGVLLYGLGNLSDDEEIIGLKERVRVKLRYMAFRSWMAYMDSSPPCITTSPKSKENSANVLDWRCALLLSTLASSNCFFSI